MSARRLVDFEATWLGACHDDRPSACSRVQRDIRPLMPSTTSTRWPLSRLRRHSHFLTSLNHSDSLQRTLLFNNVGTPRFRSSSSTCFTCTGSNSVADLDSASAATEYCISLGSESAGSLIAVSTSLLRTTALRKSPTCNGSHRSACPRCGCHPTNPRQPQSFSITLSSIEIPPCQIQPTIHNRTDEQSHRLRLSLHWTLPRLTFAKQL